MAGKKKAAAPVTALEDRMSRRLRELFEFIGEADHKKQRGWQRRIGERFNIYPADVTRILRGERRVGLDLIERVAAEINLDMRYFTSEGSPEPYIGLGPHKGDLGDVTPNQTDDDLKKAAQRAYVGLVRASSDPERARARRDAVILAHERLESMADKRAEALLRDTSDAKAASFLVCLAFDTTMTGEEYAAFSHAALDGRASEER